MMGFAPIARHRSREVLLYRQGSINVVVNAHLPTLPDGATPQDKPVIAAIALRVRDASSAYARALELGAWAVPPRVEVMELNIPAIHGVGKSRLYFVDRYDKFSIYDVDFLPIHDVSQPMGIKIAYEALSWGRSVNEFPQARDIICEADMPNLGLGFDSFHMFATNSPLDDLDMLDPAKVFLVQLADFMWTEIKSVEERIATARHFRVSPGEGVLRRAVPLPNAMRLNV